jgi:diguanylate cyclase (GGDEF)-like protein
MTDDLLAKIKGCTSLPTLPAIAMQVLELTQKEEVDLNEIARTITKDPALAGKILKTVNSSFYGRSHAVATVSHALVILGLQAVKTLVLGFSLVTSLSKDRNKGFDHMRYWRRSIYAATAARVIGVKVNCVQQEEAFLSTLLADVGVLVFNKVLGEAYDEVYQGCGSHSELHEREQSTLGSSHAEVGSYLAENWKLPPILAVPIRCHHAPETADDPQLIRISQIVGVAGRCADVFVDKAPAEALLEVRQQLQAAFDIAESEADAILAEIGTNTRETASLFEINLGSPTDFAQILKQANDALVDLTLKSQMRQTQLTEQNEILKVKASIDRLTGLSNRATLDDFLAEKFANAISQRGLLSLIMLDIDKFKSVNDTYGHQAGDAVLAVVGQLVREMARETDMAARYGGEELALILPGTSKSVAAGIAESIRRAIEARSVQSDSSTLRVTASFGVASFEPGSPFTQPTHLLKAADLAVYKAKHSGRNNVKVFSLVPAAKVA